MVSEVSAVLVVQVSPAALAVATVLRLCLPVSETTASATGRTIPPIAAEHPIRTDRRQTGLAAPLAAIRSRSARPAPASRSQDRVASCRAGPLQAAAWATLGAARDWAGAQEESAARVELPRPVVAPAEPIVSAAAIFRAAAPETELHSEAVREDSTAPVPVATVIVASPAWDLAAAAAVSVVAAPFGAVEVSAVEAPFAAVEVSAAEAVFAVVEVSAAEAAAAVAEDGAGERRKSYGHRRRSTHMKSKITNTKCWAIAAVVSMAAWVSVIAADLHPAQHPTAKTGHKTVSTPASGARLFDTPQQAADALIAAAGKFDVTALIDIFGPAGEDIVLSGEFAQDRQRAEDFAGRAHEKTSVSIDPKNGNRAFLLVGDEDWPFPLPLVKSGQKWFFDSKAGRQELLYRRIGANELDAIAICRGYVEAQHEYALEPRAGYEAHQYAQHIVSPTGEHDGLAWRNPDGTWGGPIGENIAEAIEQGYSSTTEPYHGYFFKILKGQGPAAPLGKMDYVVDGIMIGGFALVAAPAEYGVTGVRTFIVSQDGVVYERDLGAGTLEAFNRMELFDPDKSWQPIQAESAQAEQQP